MGVGKIPSSSAKLDVNGSIAVYGTVKLSSDERLKYDIIPLKSKAIDIYKLNAKSYKKHLPYDKLEVPDQVDKDGKLRPGKVSQKEKQNKITHNETTEYGFLAQDIKEIFPDLVSQDTLGYYLVDYNGLIPIMVEALKEQKYQISKQSEQIENQNNQIADLKEIVNKLLLMNNVKR